MAVLLVNVVVDVYRSPFGNIGGQTSGVTPYLKDLYGHINAVNAQELLSLPESALHSNYNLKVESGTDIALGDQIANIRLYEDRTTLWPSDLSSYNLNVAYWVRLVIESTPLFLPVRRVFLERIQTGGSSHQ